MNQLSEQISVGSFVTVTEEGWDEVETYRIVLPHEADPGRGWVSNHSPFGQALLNHSVGKTVSVNAPAGELRFKIVTVQ